MNNFPFGRTSCLISSNHNIKNIYIRSNLEKKKRITCLYFSFSLYWTVATSKKSLGDISSIPELVRFIQIVARILPQHDNNKMRCYSRLFFIIHIFANNKRKITFYWERLLMWILCTRCFGVYSGFPSIRVPFDYRWRTSKTTIVFNRVSMFSGDTKGYWYCKSRLKYCFICSINGHHMETSDWCRVLG